MNLRSLDLNLLVAFEALVSEKHVSRAAQKIHLSQPAMSHALAKLRHVLQDDILVRGPHGMEPTPKAIELSKPIGEALQSIQNALRTTRAAAAPRGKKTFVIAMSDYSATLVLPRAMPRIRAMSPLTDIIVRHANAMEAQQLVETNQVDLAVGNFRGVAANGVHVVEMLQERFVCVASRDHPAFKPRISFSDYLRYPHVLVSIREDPIGTIDAALDNLHQKRRIALVVPHYSVAGAVLPGTDLVVSVSERVALHFDSDNLAICPLPLQVAALPLVQLYLERFEESDHHRWLRDLFAEIVSGPEVCATPPRSRDIGAWVP